MEPDRSEDAGGRLARLRDPAYTGANRCRPCTVLNVVLAAVLSLFVALASVPASIVVFALALVVVYLRGYLVPGTPALTQRYLPEPVLVALGKPAGTSREPIQSSSSPSVHGAAGAHDGPAETSESGHAMGQKDEDWETIEKLEYERANAVDPEQFLRTVGAVEPIDDAGGSVDAGSEPDTGPRNASDGNVDLQFTAAFAEQLATERASMVDDGSGDDSVERRDRVATLFDEPPAAIDVLDRDHPAVTVDSRVRQWPSEVALVSDLAADATLRDWTDRWDAVPLEQRLGILESLRAFYEACPSCGGSLEFGDEAVRSCCHAAQVVTLACTDCEAHLLEFGARS